jgi:hypothetical protein
MLRSSTPAVGVHSSAIACGMILDEGDLLYVCIDVYCVVRLRCLFWKCCWVEEGREKRGFSLKWRRINIFRLALTARTSQRSG